LVSNFVSMAVAGSDGACSDLTGLSATDFANFAAAGAVSSAQISLSRDANVNPSDAIDEGYANFEQYPYPNFSLTQLPLQILNYGACSVYTYYGSVEGVYAPPFEVATRTVNAIPGTALDAGAAIAVSGPNGVKQITPVAPLFPAIVGNYYTELGGPQPNPQPALPPYLSPGSYTISGAGGKDVGPFTVSTTITTPLTWVNQSSINTITRANGVNVTWAGADPNSFVVVSGWSLSTPGASAGFNCTVSAGAGQFTVPAVVLLALPPSYIIMEDGQSQPAGNLTVGTVTPPVRFSATGLNLGLVTTSISFPLSGVQYQ
jgi:hypothetical protein